MVPIVNNIVHKCKHGNDSTYMIPCLKCEEEMNAAQGSEAAIDNLFLMLCRTFGIDVLVKWLARKFDRWDNKHEE